MKSWPLRDKIARAETLILSELKEAKHPMVACSWGKDSMVLLHLVLKFCKRPLVVFENTGVEYPETYAYRDKILEEWGPLNYYETKPIKTFWECVRLYGYPKFRQYADQGGKKRRAAPKCCYYLKEKPAMDFIKKNKVDVEFLGLQASESMNRRLNFLKYGEVIESKTYKTKIVRPLMVWTDKDIWNYHTINRIPANKLYTKMDRNGCMPCTGFKLWKQTMAKYNQPMYKHIATALGEPPITTWCK
jgi:phosphoadenosine phosphosulfate reductase